jgi:hypothetical protein
VKPEINEADPPPGEGFDTVTERTPSVAPLSRARRATNSCGPVAEREVTVIPGPNEAVVTPLMNPPPRSVTASDWPTAPLRGETLVNETCGFETRKPFRNAPRPWELLTDTSLNPVGADEEMEMFIVRSVTAVRATEFTAIPEPEKLTLVPAGSRLDALITIFIVVPLTP